MHIYIFGSICRGEIDANSDIDMLALVNGYDNRFDPNDFSIYNYERINQLWSEGNPFSWHLFLESKLVYSDNNMNYLKALGAPSKYNNGISDCMKFRDIFESACNSLTESNHAEVFDFSSIFLSIRNFATCFSLTLNEKPDFSRNSALNLGSYSLKMDEETYKLLERCRVLCVRGKGNIPSHSELRKIMNSTGIIKEWMGKLLEEIKLFSYERV